MRLMFMSREKRRTERHKETAGYRWHCRLVEQCRPYRATHMSVLRSVRQHMRGAYGERWYMNRKARALAVETLRKFGVNVTE